MRFPCSSPWGMLFSLLSKVILEQPWWAQFQKWMANLREQRLAQITCKSRLKIQFHLRFHWERCMLRKLCEFVNFKFPIIFTQIQCCMLKWEEQFPTKCLINWSMYDCIIVCKCRGSQTRWIKLPIKVFCFQVPVPWRNAGFTNSHDQEPPPHH